MKTKKLSTVAEYARRYVRKNGKVGVSTQFIRDMVMKGKLESEYKDGKMMIIEEGGKV
jgi:hypothetical protein